MGSETMPHRMTSTMFGDALQHTFMYVMPPSCSSAWISRNILSRKYILPCPFAPRVLLYGAKPSEARYNKSRRLHRRHYPDEKRPDNDEDEQSPRSDRREREGFCSIRRLWRKKYYHFLNRLVSSPARPAISGNIVAWLTPSSFNSFNIVSHCSGSILYL